jgi:hypothetical protein
MDKIRNSWWGSIITHVLGFVVLIFILPTIPLVFFNSRSLLLALVVFGFFFGPLYLAKFHKGSYRMVGLMQVIATGFFFATWPSEQLGNYKLQMADHMTGWALFAFVGCGVLQSFHLWRASKVTF